MTANVKKLNFSSSIFIEKIKKRETSSIESLVKSYTKQLMNAAFGLGLSESDADELVQSVWVTFFEKVPNFEGRSHIRTFIFGILYNKAKELKRDRHKYTSDDPFEEIMSDKFNEKGQWINPPIDPEKFLENAQTLEIIQQCMEQLPLQQRMVFHLKEVLGNTTEEICNIIEVTTTNLGVLLYRSKNKLRDCIERKSI